MKRVMKWLGVSAGSLTGVVTLAYAALHVMSEQRINATYSVEVASLNIPDDSAGIARGRHVARAMVKCGECHGSRMEGRVFFEDPVIGRFAGPNITPGGAAVQGYTDDDWIRAVRHGIRRDGRSVMAMPSYEFWHLTDDDMAALVAYMKSLPTVAGEVPAVRFGPMARVLAGAGLFPLLAAEGVDHTAPRPPAPTVAATPEYGRYLADIGCAGCHGHSLQGGKPMGTGPDLLLGGTLAGWTEEDFRLALRAGRRPDGTVISTDMPWYYTTELSDLEISALWNYVRSLSSALN